MSRSSAPCSRTEIRIVSFSKVYILATTLSPPAPALRHRAKIQFSLIYNHGLQSLFLVFLFLLYRFLFFVVLFIGHNGILI